MAQVRRCPPQGRQSSFDQSQPKNKCKLLAWWAPMFIPQGLLSSLTYVPTIHLFIKQQVPFNCLFHVPEPLYLPLTLPVESDYYIAVYAPLHFELREEKLQLSV